MHFYSKSPLRIIAAAGPEPILSQDIYNNNTGVSRLEHIMS